MTFSLFAFKILGKKIYSPFSISSNSDSAADTAIIDIQKYPRSLTMHIAHICKLKTRSLNTKIDKFSPSFQRNSDFKCLLCMRLGRNVETTTRHRFIAVFIRWVSPGIVFEWPMEELELVLPKPKYLI